MLCGWYIKLKDQAQYALCDWCVFKRHNRHDFFFFNFALKCELSEHLLFLLFYMQLTVMNYKTTYQCSVTCNSSDFAFNQCLRYTGLTWSYHPCLPLPPSFHKHTWPWMIPDECRTINSCPCWQIVLFYFCFIFRLCVPHLLIGLLVCLPYAWCGSVQVFKSFSFFSTFSIFLPSIFTTYNWEKSSLFFVCLVLSSN